MPKNKSDFNVARVVVIVPTFSQLLSTNLNIIGTYGRGTLCSIYRWYKKRYKKLVRLTIGRRQPGILGKS